MKVGVVDEHGHLHLFAPDQVEALAAVGLVWREGDHWRFDATRVDLGQWPELAMCDFCSERPVTWEITADDFALTVGIEYRSVNNWVACETCGAFIAAGDRRSLETRALAFCQQRVALTGLPFAPFAAAHREFLRQFWRHYRSIRRYDTPYGPPQEK